MSTARWIASSIPRPRRSNFTSPTAAQSSLSHWSTVRFSMRAHSTGQTSETGRSQITMPPGWMPRWRGKPSSSVATASTLAGIPSSLAASPGPGSTATSSRPGRPSPVPPAAPAPPAPRPPPTGVLPRPRRRRSTTSSGPCGAARRDGGRHRASPSCSMRFAQASIWPGEWPRALAASRTRGACPVAHDDRHEGGPLAAVAPVDVLDDLLAPPALDVHVDVGRPVALGRQEALEQQPERDGIRVGDPEHVADRRARCGALGPGSRSPSAGRTRRCPIRRGSSRQIPAPRSSPIRAPAVATRRAPARPRRARSAGSRPP